MNRFLFFVVALLVSSSFLFSQEIKAVIFDCGGVVVRSNRTQVMQFLAESFAISLEELKGYLAQEELLDLATGKVKEPVFWESFAKKHQLSLPADFHKRYLSFLKNAFPADENILDLVQSLQEAGLHTPMLSDVTEWQAEGFKEVGIYGHFSPVFLSCEIGLKKPDPAVFQYLLSRLALAPSACVFVDDKKENITAAEECGIDGICYTTVEKLKRALKERGIEAPIR